MISNLTLLNFSLSLRCRLLPEMFIVAKKLFVLVLFKLGIIFLCVVMGVFCNSVESLLPGQVVLALLELPFVRLVFVAVSGRNIPQFRVNQPRLKVAHIPLLLIPLVLPLTILTFHEVLIHRFTLLVIVLPPVVTRETLIEASFLIVE